VPHAEATDLVGRMSEEMNPSSSPASRAFLSVAQDSDATTVRPRNRRVRSSQYLSEASSTYSDLGATKSPDIPAARIGSVTGRNDSGKAVVRPPTRSRSSGPGGGLLGNSWVPSWSSVQELAASVLGGGTLGLRDDSHRPHSRDGSRTRKSANNGNSTWGPVPPTERRPRADDIGAGLAARRADTLKTLRTASILESHEGVNGGLDVMGKFKRRSSDADLNCPTQSQEPTEYLAYIHHVQSTDTYAGIVLKYRCREDAFRKANGLWSRDNIQVRKWLAIPVDACEVKGRPCDPPASSSKPKASEPVDPFGWDIKQDDPFAPITNGKTTDHTRDDDDDDKPWKHVRWVYIESFPEPVEVARVPRKVLGYFPPRRKKSMQTSSAVSTPRASTDQPSAPLPDSVFGSPRSSTSYRLPIRTSSSSSRSRLNSTSSSGNPASAGLDDPRPAWMRRPGGVGSLGRNVRAPGPENDPLNTWTNKHLPGLNIDSLPSMSVMGAVSAHFGFSKTDELLDPDGSPAAAALIVESPFEDGRDATSAATGGGQGSLGLEKAAAAVEMWLRGAIERAKHVQVPLTPVLGPRGGKGGGGVLGLGGGHSGAEFGTAPGEGDLIELTDTLSDDDRHQTTRSSSSVWDAGGLLSPVLGASSSRISPGARGRSGFGGDKKAD